MDGNGVKLRTNVTINIDGSRWTGDLPDPLKPSLFIFGDSFVFGEGVNNEQTFSFLLQQALPNFNVRLFAAPAYSLTQAFLNFERLKHEISDRDAIIVGYGDFYDERHVLAPAFLRALNDPTVLASGNRNRLLPKASVDPNGVVSFSYLTQDCCINRLYCEQPDPAKEEMQNVTAALANHIADNTNAKLYFLHFAGAADNPVLDLLSKRFTLISALPSDFDYQIRDDVMGYDAYHPGPYWHYAMFKKLKAALGG
jgi:hypothetical protein